MSDILEEFFGSTAAIQPQLNTRTWFDDFGLTENPFPPNRRIVPEVLFGQERAYGQFKALVRDLLQAPTPQRRAMGVLAGTGGGKTHFLRHCQYKLLELRRVLKRPFAIVEHTVGTLKVLDLVREIYRQCSAACREHAGTDFLTALAQALSQPGAEAAVGDLALEDVRSALSHLRDALDRPGDYDATRELCERWLQAETLSATERKRLGVTSRIGSATVSIRVLGQVLGLARHLKVVEGVLLCLDELEALFSMGARFAQVQAFLHELRYLYDDAVIGEKGYSVLIVSASTDTGLDALRRANYPVFQRLGFEETLELQRIHGVTEAIEFAHYYIDHFHRQWRQLHPSEEPVHEPYSLLPSATIERVFREASRGAQEAPQGSLLDALHYQVEALHPTRSQPR